METHLDLADLVDCREVHMPADDDYKTVQDFLEKMDSGELDGIFTNEPKKLTKEQLEQLAQILVNRDTTRNPQQKGFATA